MVRSQWERGNLLRICTFCMITGGILDVEELVGDFFGGECIEHGHDPSGEFEI
jgi:hypothetical protein